MAPAFRHKLASKILGDDFVIVPKRFELQRPERQFFRNLLSRLDVDCVFDIGANIGQTGRTLRSIGFKGLIFSFEPDPDCFETLKKNSRSDKKWFVFNVALGDVPGTATLNIMEFQQLNSFYAPSSAETAFLEKANTKVGQIDVPVTTLNDVYCSLKEKHDFVRPFLKIDTQGHDVSVFKGGDKVVKNFLGMESEVSVKRIYKNTPNWQEAIGLYEAAGFELAGLYSVNPHAPYLIELDCYLVQKEAQI